MHLGHLPCLSHNVSNCHGMDLRGAF
jgi:hypothetical protein